MAQIKLTLEYHGAEFAGWAAQPGHRTVEDTLGGAIERVTGVAPELSVAGRTDAGVHAWGQVASFGAAGREVDAGRLARSLNGVLPQDVAVGHAEQAADGFDARRSARARTYCYRVLARPAPSPFERARALWWPHPIESGALDECAALLSGTHDFTAFTPTRTEHIRLERKILRAEWVRDGDVLAFWVEADTFMRHMVRVLVGTMLEVGAGDRSVEEFASLLGGAPRSSAGDTVQAHGLYLASVRY
jgi:tRNA pseudouridine38-40 synthase